MIAETFAAAGAKTTLLPGGEVFSALEKGTIDAADYTGPAVNYALGFHHGMGKVCVDGLRPVFSSVYQPVDLMDFVVATTHWNQISPKMKKFVDDEIQIYSNRHFSAIQKADMEARPLLEKAGVEVNRTLPRMMSTSSSRLRCRSGIRWANKDKDAARLFKLQLDIMKNPSFGYVNPQMIEGQKLDL